MFSNRKLTILVLLLVFILAACTAVTPTPEPTSTPIPPAATSEPAPADVPEQGFANASRGYRIAFVTHGGASSAFWSVVMRGAEQAEKDMGVIVDYKAPETFDLVQMARLIDDAAASKPDGLIVSIPDANALVRPIRAAISAGIPVLSINSGSDIAEQLGAIAHIGQLEYQAGYQGGQELIKAGVTKALCLNQEVGNVALDLRCQGIADALSAQGIDLNVVAVSVSNSDPAGSEANILNTLTEALAADPAINAIVTLGNSAARPTLNVLRQNSTFDQLIMGTFDLSPEVLAAIRDGEILFTIDQQPYMQGYLPVVYMTLYLDNRNVPGGPIVLTGPNLVTQENAAEIIELSEQGTR